MAICCSRRSLPKVGDVVKSITLDNVDCADITFGSGKTIIVDTQYTLKDIPKSNKHNVVFKAPKTITENYTDEEGSMFLGSKFNYHNGNICLDHINRMNAVGLQLNIPFLNNTKEEPKKVITNLNQQIQWGKFAADSLMTYVTIGKKEFHLLHKYDARGRCYSEGYHVNYQGSSFKKAIIQLANKEIIKGDS